MTLGQAVLCADCDEVFNHDEHTRCPRCTSRFYLRLHSILKGTPRERKRPVAVSS